MTTPRTIPANPQPGDKIGSRTPGERFALPVLNTWTVFHQYADSHSVVAAGLSERDAKLLVFGAKAVEALRECMSWMECGCGHRSCKRCAASREALAALADMEVPAHG